MVRHSALKGLYDVEKTIGCGGFAKVKLATHIATGEKVAIKIIDKTCIGEDLYRVKLELEALQSLSHPNICKLYQVIETDTHFFIVVDYCSGGELFDHIVERQRVTECQSRIFFRQIVSAVGYLHSMGYAHRDLKPENVLLDKDETLKLIDFGLCAKPDGGMMSMLSTSCGSPTYAAPELVTGQKYYGSAVDVWSLGVLLYALLCGFLPFDDNNISSLYKKIINGQYEEPSWLSSGSKSIIKSMLQVCPEKRISIKELSKHPWLTLGVLKPVSFDAPPIHAHRDEYCVSVMARAKNISSHEMWNEIRKWRYDYDTATYLLLCSRKSKSLPLKLYIPQRLQFRTSLASTSFLQSPNDPLRKKTKFCTSPVKLEPIQDRFNTKSKRNVDICVTLASPSKKPVKRIHSPGPDNENSPVPAKLTPGRRYDDSLQNPPRTPDRNATTQSETPSSARKVLGSIERSINRVRHVLTPRRRKIDSAPEFADAPQVLTAKNLCNVSITTCVDPDYVLNELRKALFQRGISCRQKGYILRGKMEPSIILSAAPKQASSTAKQHSCSFELEVCMIATPAAAGCGGARVAIRRKRLKGDAWCYKKVCEEVLALAAAHEDASHNHDDITLNKTVLTISEEPIDENDDLSKPSTSSIITH